MLNQPSRPEGFQQRRAFGPAAVQVHRNVHGAGRNGERHLQPFRWKHLEASHQLKDVRQPRWPRINQPMAGEGPAQRMEGRDCDQKVAEFEGPQDQQRWLVTGRPGGSP